LSVDFGGPVGLQVVHLGLSGAIYPKDKLAGYARLGRARVNVFAGSGGTAGRPGLSGTADDSRVRGSGRYEDNLAVSGQTTLGGRRQDPPGIGSICERLDAVMACRQGSYIACRGIDADHVTTAAPVGAGSDPKK
jgi:hypothetical protein